MLYNLKFSVNKFLARHLGRPCIRRLEGGGYVVAFEFRGHLYMTNYW